MPFDAGAFGVALESDKFRKPQRWQFDRSLVREDFSWFWDGSEASVSPQWDGAGGPLDLVTGQRGTLISDTEWVTTPTGLALELNDDSKTGGDAVQLTYLGTDFFNGLTEFTLGIYVTYIGTSDQTDEDTLWGQYEALQGENSALNRRAMLRYASIGNSVQFYISNSTHGAFSVNGTGDLEDGLPHVIVGRYSDSANLLDLWLDGVQLNSTTSVGALPTSSRTVYPEAWGGHFVTTDGKDSGRIRGHTWAFHKRAWSDSEIVQYSRDPFGPFRPDMAKLLPMMIKAPAAGGSILPQMLQHGLYAGSAG